MTTRIYPSPGIALIHVTPRRNLCAIRTRGLRPDLATGNMRVVWLHTPSLLTWSLRHVSRHHGVTADDMAVIHLSLPRRHLTRWRRGIYLCTSVIDV